MFESALWASLPDELGRLLHVPIERREIPVSQAVFEGMLANNKSSDPTRGPGMPAMVTVSCTAGLVENGGQPKRWPH